MKNKEAVKDIIDRIGILLADENLIDVAFAAATLVHVATDRLPETQIAILANALGSGEHKRLAREIVSEGGVDVFSF